MIGVDEGIEAWMLTLYDRMGMNVSGATARQKSGRKMAEASAGSFRHSTCGRGG